MCSPERVKSKFRSAHREMGGVGSEFDGGKRSLKGADWLRRKMPASATRVENWEGAE